MKSVSKPAEQATNEENTENDNEAKSVSESDGEEEDSKEEEDSEHAPQIIVPVPVAQVPPPLANVNAPVPVAQVPPPLANVNVPVPVAQVPPPLAPVNQPRQRRMIGRLSCPDAWKYQDIVQAHDRMLRSDVPGRLPRKDYTIFYKKRSYGIIRR